MLPSDGTCVVAAACLIYCLDSHSYCPVFSCWTAAFCLLACFGFSDAVAHLAYLLTLKRFRKHSGLPSLECAAPVQQFWQAAVQSNAWCCSGSLLTVFCMRQLLL